MTRKERTNFIGTICDRVCEEACVEAGIPDSGKRRIKTQAKKYINEAYAEYQSKVYYKVWKRKSKYQSVIITFALAIIAILTLFFFALFLYSKSSNFTWSTVLVSSATMLGAVSAVSGWCFSSWISIRNSVAQHTITLAFTRLSQSSFSENVLIFQKSFADSKNITFNLIEKMSLSGEESDRKAIHAMKYILNYFEFIAAGVALGDLNLDYIKRTMRGQIIYYYERCEDFIDVARYKDPRALEHLYSLKRYLERT